MLAGLLWGSRWNGLGEGMLTGPKVMHPRMMRFFFCGAVVAIFVRAYREREEV